MTRRHFMGSGGRMFILVLMLCGIGFLALKRRISLRGYCDDNARCAACRLNTICLEPQKQTTSINEKQST
jgi:hypothetical protein